jgi:hypothetical protein
MTPRQFAVAAVARAICRETCAFKGEPPCWTLANAHEETIIFPPPTCDEPGCVALAEAAVVAFVAVQKLKPEKP